MSPQTVIDALAARPDLAADTDADAATALNTPVHAPKAGRLTLASLADATAWGFAKTAAFRASLEAVAASGGQAGATAGALLDLLKGPGFALSDPQVAAMAPAIVALSSGTVSAADADAVLIDTSYPCGTPDVTAADVALARRLVAFQAGRVTLVNEKVNPAISAIEADLDARYALLLVGKDAVLPSVADVVTEFKTAVGG